MKDFNAIISAYQRRGRSAVIHGIKHSQKTKLLTGFGSPWDPTRFVAGAGRSDIFAGVKYEGDASPLKPLHVRHSNRYRVIKNSQGLSGVADFLGAVEGMSGASTIPGGPEQLHRVFFTNANKGNQAIKFHESIHQMEGLFQRLNPQAHSDIFGNFLSIAKKNKAFNQFAGILRKQSSVYKKFDNHKIGRELLAYYAQYKKYGSTGLDPIDSILARFDKDKRFFNAAEDLGIMENPNKVIHHILQQGGMKLPTKAPLTPTKAATQQIARSSEKIRLIFDLETVPGVVPNSGIITSAALAENGSIVFEGAHKKAELFDINKFKSLDSPNKTTIDLSGKQPALFEQLSQNGFITQGVSGPELSVSDGQKRYLEAAFQTQEHLDKYYTPSLENTKNLVDDERVLISNLADRINGAVEKSNNVSLSGYNIEKFDIPKLIERLRDSGEHARAGKLEQSLKVIKIEDISDVFKKAVNAAVSAAPDEVKATELGQRWLALNHNNKGVFGWSLDVAAETLGLSGRSGSGHGVQEDVKVAEAVFEALNKGTIVDVEKYASALEKFGPEHRKEEIAHFAAATRKQKNVQQAVVVQEQVIEAATATQKVAEQIVDTKNVLGEVTVSIPHRTIKMPSTNLPKGLFTKKNAALLGLGVAGFIALKTDKDTEINNTLSSLFTSVNPFAGRQEYITSSFLGVKDESDLYGRINDPTFGDATRYKNAGEKRKANEIMEVGDSVHHNIQSGLLARGIASSAEYYVEDPKNKVFGYVDVMKSSGVPLEIKSTSLKSLNKMKAPQQEHISQANFYALATKSATAEILYVAKEDQSKTKLFTIQADSSRYIKDIQTVRQFQDKIGGISSKIFGFSNFRPASSWFGGGINYNMPYAHKADIASQKGRLSNLPVSQYMPQAQDQRNNHPSRAGV